MVRLVGCGKVKHLTQVKKSKSKIIRGRENLPNLTNLTTSKSKEQIDRTTQFWEAEECKDIIAKCTKAQVLKWFKDNPSLPSQDYKEMFKALGDGCLKFRNELIKEGKI